MILDELFHDGGPYHKETSPLKRTIIAKFKNCFHLFSNENAFSFKNILTFSFEMLKNGKTYFKNLAV